jgi:predicted NBD/HSP70 family sugar kinase
VIIRQLEREGLLIKGEPVRGRVGQPSVPLMIHPRGAFMLGLKVGRRSAELVLTDFAGAVLGSRRQSYRWPTPEGVLAFVERHIAAMMELLAEEERGRVAGLGVAIPFELWNWPRQTGAPAAEMDKWRDVNLQAALAAQTGLPVFLQNDATAACGAELLFGRQGVSCDFIYFYVGTFIGGGVVLNGGLYAGRSGNAGAIGPMPVSDERGNIVQIIELTSIILLERMLVAAGIDPSPLWDSPGDWPDFGPSVEEWIETVGFGLAQAIVASVSVIDFDMAVIDGSLPAAIRARIVEATQRQIARLDLQGVRLPAIEEGRVGVDARMRGAASLPLVNRFLLQRNALPGPDAALRGRMD